MKRLFLILWAACLALAPARGGERLVDVMTEQTLSAGQILDSLIAEFGAGFDAEKYKAAFGMLKSSGRDVTFASVRYRTVDPLGKEVIASGLIAFPEKDEFRGTIEISPICKEKYLAGSIRNFTIECMASTRGFVSLVPDTIGYGATDNVPIALLINDNTARVSADLRLAAEEFFAERGRRRLPRRSILFGFSLGASGAVATACYYNAHPEMKVKVTKMILGCGPYDPSVSIRSTLAKADCGYLLYPAIALSFNHWKELGMQNENLFIGDVLKDYDYITEGNENLHHLADVYGHDPHVYLHPDFFTEQQNPDIVKLMTALSESSVPKAGDRIPKGVTVYLRHSVVDDFVPVECADAFCEILRKQGIRVKYRRDAEGTHYEEAGKSFADIFVITLL